MNKLALMIVVFVMSYFLFGFDALANLNGTTELQQGVEKEGDVFGTIKAIGASAIALAVAAVLVMFAFTIIESAREKYAEIKHGKSTYLEVGGIVVFGVCLLIFAVIAVGWVIAWWA